MDNKDMNINQSIKALENKISNLESRSDEYLRSNSDRYELRKLYRKLKKLTNNEEI
jgi:hypothetical protein